MVRPDDDEDRSPERGRAAVAGNLEHLRGNIWVAVDEEPAVTGIDRAAARCTAHFVEVGDPLTGRQLTDQGLVDDAPVIVVEVLEAGAVELEVGLLDVAPGVSLKRPPLTPIIYVMKSETYQIFKTRTPCRGFTIHAGSEGATR